MLYSCLTEDALKFMKAGFMVRKVQPDIPILKL